MRILCVLMRCVVCVCVHFVCVFIGPLCMCVRVCKCMCIIAVVSRVCVHCASKGGEWWVGGGREEPAEFRRGEAAALAVGAVSFKLPLPLLPVLLPASLTVKLQLLPVELRPVQDSNSSGPSPVQLLTLPAQLLPVQDSRPRSRFPVPLCP